MNEGSWNQTIPTRRLNDWIKLELASSNYRVVHEPKDKIMITGEMVYVYG